MAHVWVKQRSSSGEALVRRWASIGQVGGQVLVKFVLVKYWSIIGQVLVKYWSSIGQALVK